MMRAIERRLRSFLTLVAFERRFRTQTSGRVETGELGYVDDRFEAYEPAAWRTLQYVLPKRSVAADDVFVDLGCGMGRMVLRAAEYPFARVIGVEVSPDLLAIAQRNFESNRERLRCSAVEWIQADVSSYELDDAVTVVFMNNPFSGEVFEAAVDSLLRSVDRRPRQVRIIYRNPVEHERLIGTGRVRTVSEWRKGAWRGRGRGVTVRCYEVMPAAASA